MTTTITKNFHVDYPVDVTWANLTDPNKVVVCVPGASLTSQVDENNYKGEVELKVGPVKSKYDGLQRAALDKWGKMEEKPRKK